MCRLHSIRRHKKEEIDFDWLDKRSMDPVGYKRVNKRTGNEITEDNIVKGIKQENGDHVVLRDDEIRKAYPKSTQTIQIEQFVPADQISFVYLEKPYYLEPIGRSERVYALLREAMTDAALIGIARLVIRNKEHLAELLPAGPALMIGTLRCPPEIRSSDGLKLPPEGRSATHLKDAELKMAQQLIQDMTSDWKPQAFNDEFTAAIRAFVARKFKAGELHAVEPLEETPDYGANNVVNLAELLKRSLNRTSAKAGDKAESHRSAGTGKISARKHAVG